MTQQTKQVHSLPDDLTTIDTNEDTKIQVQELDLISRPPTPDENIVSVNLTDLNAKLAHVYISLSLTNKRESTIVKALHDSGCSHSIISKDTFLTIPGANLSMIKSAHNIQISGFNGSVSPIIGTVTIKLRFTGDNGINKSYPRTVIVHDNISHDFMLGRDFTGSDNKLFETTTHIYLIDSYDAVPITPDELFDIAKFDYCSVPIMQTLYGQIPITSNTDEHIPVSYTHLTLPTNREV